MSPAEPISREDALAKRLKSLREGQGEAANPVTQDPPPPYSETAGSSLPPKGLSQRLQSASPPAKKAKSGDSPTPLPETAAENAHLDADEDRTLEEILDGLVLEDDQWSMSEDEGDQSASKRVEELLANLGKKTEAHESAHSDEMERDDTNDHGKDDDSEGEEMTRQADDILARTLDDINIEGHSKPTDSNNPSISPNSRAAAKPDPSTADMKIQDSDLALPDVPQTPTEDQPLPDLPSTADDGSGLTLPTVPTILQDPVPASKAPDDPFESSIAVRLAALKGPGHKPITTDAFGLPSAPTFQPEDRPVPKVAKKPGYSDDDMKTWCIVCLEEATVRCMGCDGDVYCARCWREMHVGPSAGYDERGHAWEKFDPRKL